MALNLIVALFFGTACKSDSDTKLEFPEEFRGVIWEYAEDDSSEFFMEFYDTEIEFTSNYDFEDCYFISKAELVEINSEGKFFIEEVEDGEIIGSSAYIKREGNELWVSGVKTYQTKDVYVQSTVSTSSFEPKCDDSPLKSKRINSKNLSLFR